MGGEASEEQSPDGKLRVSGYKYLCEREDVVRYAL